MRAIWPSVFVGVCLLGAAHAADLLCLDSQAGDYIGAGIPQRFTPADGTFDVSRNFDNGVSVGVSAGARGSWSLVRRAARRRARARCLRGLRSR